MKDRGAPRPRVAYTPMYLDRVARVVRPAQAPIARIEIRPAPEGGWLAEVERVDERGRSFSWITRPTYWEVCGAVRDLD